MGEEDPHAAVKTMFANAVDVENIDETKLEKKPHHFDLAGLAHSLNTEATMAHRITKLRTHVAEAKKALATHEAHVKNIKNLLSKADGEQKAQLKDVLKSAELHVKELKKTVSKANDHL